MSRPLDRETFVGAISVYLGTDRLWAETVLREFLESEGVEFGDAGYDWDDHGAEDLAKTELSYL